MVTKKEFLRLFSGFLTIIVIYVILVLIAFSYYPKDFSPPTNTLAQLGNPKLNPSGALFYNIGVFVISSPAFLIIALTMVFAGKWRASLNPRRKIVLYSTLIFMFLFSIFNIMTAIVPSSSNDTINRLFSLFFFITFELFIVFSAFGIQKTKDHIGWIPFLGFAAALLNILLFLGVIIAHLTVANWLITATSWSYMTAFIYEWTIKPPQP